MDISTPLVTHAQASKAMQPGEGTLHHPSGGTQARAVFGVAPSDLCFDAHSVQAPAILVGIVGTIGLQTRWALDRMARFAGDRRNGLDQGQELGYVVLVRPGEDERERDALRFDCQVVLGTRARAIGGVGSCF